MAHDGARTQAIEKFLATQRRINDVKSAALSKLGSLFPDGLACSFCGTSAADVHAAIRGSGDARICSVCVETLGSMLKDDQGGQTSKLF